MAVKDLYLDVQIGGVSTDVISVEVDEGYKSTTSRCSIELEDISGISLNDIVTVDAGYTGNHGQIFRGLIDEIVTTRMPGIYQLECRDILKLAVEHWLVSEDIENPWSRSNISAEDLVEDLLAEAGLTDYNGASTSFTFAVDAPAEFNLMSVWDAVRTICHILAYNCYARDNTVYFDRILPEPSGSAVANMQTGDSGNIILIDYGYNTDNLRNKVVVFGKDNLKAEASSATSYDPRDGTYKQFLPDDFYKTAIVSNQIIEESMAQDAADYNLELYNRLTEFMRLETEGNHEVRVYDTISVTEPLTGMDSDEWFVYSVAHRIDDTGYSLSLNLTR
jgi:hypothetical protein